MVNALFIVGVVDIVIAASYAAACSSERWGLLFIVGCGAVGLAEVLN